ncbi:pleckstrin homology domain-containing family G member 5-like isoform X4 [Sycon ciliatum]|uniref:pleckstrin homology domain-containing family G member 5-like isoform X4 n=1 Tax=Sycon ciliatum TaxID=27933 RepID=UPI0031F6AB4C
MESGTPGEPSANGLMREDDLLCVGTPSITSDQSFGDTSLETDHDAPICQNFPCPNNNQAALVCYHVECVKLARKSYRFYCMDCDTNQHEDAPYHVRTTVSQYQAALPYYTPSANEDTTSQSSLTIKRDRLGSGKRKKFKIRKSSDSSDPKKGGMTIALPNSTQHPVKLDDSLLRSVVQRMCTQQKIDMEFLEVVYSTNNEHVDLDNHVLAFYGVTLNVNDRAGSPRSKKLGPNSSSSRLNFGGMTFKWRRDSKGGGSTKQPHSLGSNDGNKVDRTWSHSAGASPRDNSHSISMAKSLTDLPLQRNSLQESPMPATRSMSSSSQTNARTNKKLAKLLGAEDSGLDASRHSGSEQDLHVPSGKPSKLHHRSLTEQLEMFSVYGISRDDTKSSSGQARSDFWLPSTWTGLTDNIKSLSKRNIDEQEAIWELLTTAVTHTERLWTLANVFRETLVILQEKGFLTQVKLDRLFLNISVLKEIDETYWKDQLSLVFKEAKHKGHLLKASMVAEFFDGFAERFAPYVEFCGNQPRLMKYLAVLKKEDSDFMSYLNWCESHPTCNRLQLTDMLAAPFQRLTKYPLLLKAIMKKTNDESAKEALQGHLQVVEKFLGKVNHHVSVCQRRALLQAVADRLEDNFVEVPPEYEQYVGTGLNLQDRMWTTDGMDLGERELLHEDTFKMKEFAGKYNLELKLDVLIFVFSDMLLITKQKGGGRLQLVKPPLMIYTISLTRAKDHNNILYVVQIHTVGMATGFLVLQAATPQSASGFSKAVSEAQFAYRSQVNKGHAQAAQGKGSGKSKAHTRTFSRRLVKIPGSIYKNKRRSSKSADVKLHLDSGADETSELSDGQSGDRDVHFEEGSATTSESGTPSSDMETRSFVDPPLEEVEEEEHEIARSKSTGDVVDRLCGLEAPGAVPPQSVNKGPETVNCQLTISFCDEAGEEKPVEQDT